MGHPGFGLGSRPRCKAPMVDPVVNDFDLGLTQSKKTDQIRGGVVADGNNPVLPHRQPSHDDASIEHAFPIVFTRYMKGSQVMDGRHEWARFWPQQTPVAGDV